MFGFGLMERAKHDENVSSFLDCSYTPGRIGFAFSHAGNVVENRKRRVGAQEEVALNQRSIGNSGLHQ